MKKSVILLILCLAISQTFFSQVNLFFQAPQGVTTTQVRAPNGLSTYAYMRACALVLQSDLTSLPVNSTLTAFGFTMSASTNVSTTGNFTVYLENTTNTTYLKGTNWSSITPGMTTVYSSTMTLSPSTTSVVLTLSTPFVYTGGGIYVAYDWYSAGPYATTPATYWAEGSALVPGCASANSATSGPTTLGTTAFRPDYLFGINNPYTNEVNILNIEAPGTLPGQMGTAHSVTATIRNGSNQTLNNIPVTLNVTGANTNANTQTVSALAAGISTTVVFPSYSPNNAGLNTLSVSVPPDNLNTNNSRVYTQSITCNSWALSPAGVSYTNNSVGFNTGSGIIAVSYSAPVTATLTALRGAISTNTPSVGNGVWGVLLSSAGVVVATTNTVSITNGMLGTFASFTFATPPVLSSGTSYYLGFAQPTGTVGYFPMGAYFGNPTPYTKYVTTTTVGGTPSTLTSDLGYLGIEGIFAPALTVSAASQTVTCGVQAVLSATTVGTYTWVNGPTNTNHSVTPIGNTTYSVDMSTPYGCTASNTVMVTVNPITVTANSSSLSICAGSSVVLTAGGGATSFTWNTNPVSNSTLVTVIPSATTIYSVQGSNTAGCLAGASLQVLYFPNPTVTVMSQTVVCGSQTSLSATSSDSYTWTTGPANSDFVITPTVNTTYSVTATNSAGCVQTNTAMVTVDPITVTALVSSSAICLGDTVTVAANGASTYTWNTNPVVNTGTFTDQPVASTVYVVQAENGPGCAGAASVALVVNSFTNLNVSANSLSVCAGSTLTVSATGASTYAWTDGTTMSNMAAMTLTPASSVVFTVTGFDANGCADTSMVAITVNALPTVSTTASASLICAGESSTLTAEGGVSYTWAGSSVTDNTIVVTPSTPGSNNYTVTVTDVNQCTSSAVVSLMVDACTGIANHANEGIRPLIYPNPSKGVINVIFRNTPKNASIRVTNMLGEVVADLPQAEIHNSIDLKENSNGLYLVAILQNGKVISIAKIVKE
ncbi:MAG: T9SS type A sorting domain-containing protein [Bacteroidia bacterium]|nr:T9SS type A sorting domain-containing protein [Bacteroidia bacterium]